MNQAFVRSGMMFAAVPPSWMIPWTRASGWSCWRHRPTELNSRIIASSAFLPFHGSEAAWACRPWNTTSTSSDASGWLSTWLRSQGWNSKARVDPLEEAVLDHDGLAAPPFLGRRAEEHDLSGQLIGDRGERDRRPDPGRGHRVVAAAMAEAGQGVVLGEDPDPRPGPTASATEDAAHRGRQPAGRMRDRVPVAGDRLGHPCRRLLFLERHLRVRVDPVGQLDDLVPMRFDGRGEPRLHLDVRRSRLVDGEGHGTSRLLGARAAAA